MAAATTGELTHRLDIQAQDPPTRGTDGGITDNWFTVNTRWGKIQPMRADEQIRADRPEAIATHRITLRFYAGLTPRHRLKSGARVFSILSVVNVDEASEWTMIEAKETL